jgi:DNA adenine methylase
MQTQLAFDGREAHPAAPFKSQLLKWVGSKQRWAHEIISYFPRHFGRYFEPFLGSAAVLATLARSNSVGTDSFEPLIGIWSRVRDQPQTVKRWYGERWRSFATSDRREAYEAIKASYNAHPNPADLLFLSRSCYGGVVRFRQADGFMSTPCGPHAPISPASFSRRVDEWHRRLQGSELCCCDYRNSLALARSGDVAYCDPPYRESQRILYGAQAFELGELFEAIAACKRRGVAVLLSIDGTKRSGEHLCDIGVPAGLFEREVFLNCGRSMLRRFQMEGQSLERERVADRLLLTY